jgi:hypothetical protein
MDSYNDGDTDDFFNDYHEFSKDDDGFNGMRAQNNEPYYKRYYQDRFNNKNKKLEKYI